MLTFYCHGVIFIINCRSLFVLLYFFVWSLCCLSFIPDYDYLFGIFKYMKSSLQKGHTIKWPREKGHQQKNQGMFDKIKNRNLKIAQREVYLIWMWIDWYRQYQPAEPEYVASERSERVTSFIFCRAGWYFSVSFTFRWHVHHPQIKHKHGYIYICIFAGKITWNLPWKYYIFVVLFQLRL